MWGVGGLAWARGGAKDGVFKAAQSFENIVSGQRLSLGVRDSTGRHRRGYKGLAVADDASAGAIGARLATITLELFGAAKVTAGLRLSSASRGF